MNHNTSNGYEAAMWDGFLRLLLSRVFFYKMRWIGEIILPCKQYVLILI